MNHHFNPNICYNCGGDYLEENGRLVCRHCGSYKSKTISGEEITLLYTAFQKLRLADFYEAEQEFDDILRKYPKCAQAYWGRLMSRYGIKYEEDYDGSRIPTCYAASIESVFKASDYRKAMEYAEPENREVYRQHAEYIERVRREWVEKAAKEPPYDVFICYKDSDLAKRIKRTQDSYAMQDLYIYLTGKGYRVFFSHETLRNKVGEKYEPYIFNAISTAKVMLVYGSDPDYINSTWVKNEWTRYKKRMQAGEKKQGSLLVAYDGFSPNELPLALSSTQCFDAEDRRFYSDLVDTVERLVRGNTPVSGTAFSQASACNHIPVTDPAVEPTCTKSGRTEGAHCSLCGEILKPTAMIPAKGHSEGAWKITKAPTATAVGRREKSCTVCGETLEEEILPKTASPRSTAPQASEPKPSTVERSSTGLAFAVNADGKTCTITGMGTCKDTAVIVPKKRNEYTVTAIGDSAFEGTDTIVRAVIPETVQTVGASAFAMCENLASVKLADGIHEIGDSAFSDCYALTSILLPASVKAVGDYAFSNCESMTTAVIGDGVQRVGEQAFNGCAKLSSVIVPASVCEIGEEAFSSGTSGIFVNPKNPNYCTVSGNLFSKDKKTLLQYAAGKEEASYTIPATVTKIGNGAFRYAKLSELTIPASVTSIGTEAFWGCDNLQKLHYCGTEAAWNKISLDPNWNLESAIDGVSFQKPTAAPAKPDASLPNASKGLSYQANANGTECTITGIGSCKDTDLVIPSHIDGLAVTAIGTYAFHQSKTIRSVIFPDTLKSVAVNAFLACSALEKISLSDSIESVGKWAFSVCSRLAAVDIPASLTQIDVGAFSCSAAEIRVSENNPAYQSIDGNLYTKDGKTLVQYATTRKNFSFRVPDFVTEIGAQAFQSSRLLKEIILPDSVTAIGNQAFMSCSALETLTIPDAVVTVGERAFEGCFKLTGIAIPDGVTAIRQQSFKGCKALRELVLPVSVRTVEANALEGCVGLGVIRYGGTRAQWESIQISSKWNLSCPDCKIEYQRATSSDKRAVPSVDLRGLQYSLNESEQTCTITGVGSCKDTRIVIPATVGGCAVTAIAEKAFYRCEHLQSVSFPDTLTEIGSDAFYGCVNLAAVSLPNAVTRIGDGAFAYCSSMIEAVLSDSLKNIGDGAFDGCRSLTEIIVPSGVNFIGKRTFASCAKLKTAVIACEIKKLADSMFANCINLNAIAIPSCVTEIGSEAFNGCTNLINVKLPEGLKVIGWRAFYHCKKLPGLTIPDSVGTMDQCAFGGCEAMTSMLLPRALTELRPSVFSGCTKLTDIDIHGEITKIGKNAFYDCANLEHISIPVSVTEIGDGAFFFCKKLSAVTYRGSKKQWKKITLAESWHEQSAIATVKCSFGSIKIKD